MPCIRSVPHGVGIEQRGAIVWSREKVIQGSVVDRWARRSELLISWQETDRVV